MVRLVFPAAPTDAQFIKRFREAERPGLYCRVIREGSVQAGDQVILEPLSGEPVTLIEIFRDYYEKKASEETFGVSCAHRLPSGQGKT